MRNEHQHLAADAAHAEGAVGVPEVCSCPPDCPSYPWQLLPRIAVVLSGAADDLRPKRGSGRSRLRVHLAAQPPQGVLSMSARPRPGNERPAFLAPG